MAYTKKLINEVKELYPNHLEMHKLADGGDVWLGRYLDDSCGGGIPLDTVLTALNLEELQMMARFEKRKINLYKEWCKQDPRKKIGG